VISLHTTGQLEKTLAIRSRPATAAGHPPDAEHAGQAGFDVL
jgi:hypothetical protein